MSAVHTILAEISQLDLKEGGRLPSERTLAERCTLSRTSIRNALKELQSRRVVDVKQGSGYYLSSQFALQQALDGKDSCWTLERILKLIEARTFVELQVAVMATEAVTAETLDKLELYLVDMGKATVTDNAGLLVNFRNLFCTALQGCCPNQEFVRMLDEVRIPQDYLVMLMQGISEGEMSLFFADHVTLFQAVKQRDYPKVKEMVGQLNERLAGFFEKYAVPVFA